MSGNDWMLANALENKAHRMLDEIHDAQQVVLEALARLTASIRLHDDVLTVLRSLGGDVGSVEAQRSMLLEPVRTGLESAMVGTPGHGLSDDLGSAVYSWGGALLPRSVKGREDQIWEILRLADRPMRSAEIADQMGRHGWLRGVADGEALVAAVLSRGVKAGRFTRPERGIYWLDQDDPSLVSRFGSCSAHGHKVGVR